MATCATESENSVAHMLYAPQNFDISHMRHRILACPCAGSDPHGAHINSVAHMAICATEFSLSVEHIAICPTEFQEFRGAFAICATELILVVHFPYMRHRIKIYL